MPYSSFRIFFSPGLQQGQAHDFFRQFFRSAISVLPLGVPTSGFQTAHRGNFRFAQAASHAFQRDEDAAMLEAGAPIAPAMFEAGAPMHATTEAMSSSMRRHQGPRPSHRPRPCGVDPMARPGSTNCLVGLAYFVRKSWPRRPGSRNRRAPSCLQDSPRSFRRRSPSRAILASLFWQRRPACGFSICAEGRHLCNRHALVVRDHDDAEVSKIWPRLADHGLFSALYPRYCSSLASGFPAGSLSCRPGQGGTGP